MKFEDVKVGDQVIYLNEVWHVERVMPTQFIMSQRNRASGLRGLRVRKLDGRVVGGRTRVDHPTPELMHKVAQHALARQLRSAVQWLSRHSGSSWSGSLPDVQVMKYAHEVVDAVLKMKQEGVP